MQQVSEATIDYQIDNEASSSRIQYLNQNSNNSVNKESREKLVNWMLDSASNFTSNPKVPQLAVFYLDSFLNQKLVRDPKVLELIGIVSINLALKIEVGNAFTPQCIKHIVSDRFSLNQIATTEVFMLNCLEWKLLFHTPAEIARSLLEDSCEGNCSKIIELADNYSALCLADAELYTGGPLIIAISSICCSLQKLNLTKFQENWLLWVQEKTQVKPETIENFKHFIYEKIKKFY